METKVDNVQNVSPITRTTSTPALADINSDKPKIILDDNMMVKNPTNILSQDKSKITTNPFIPNEQKIKEGFKVYYALNRQKLIDYTMKWQKDNAERYKEYKHYYNS